MKVKILNTEQEDYHVHSLNFSDGFATVDEIVVFAGKLGMKKIVITDHSQVAVDARFIARNTPREILLRWKNVHNNVEVAFGIEGDLLNEKGDICDELHGMKSDFLILSYHPITYKGDKNKVTEGFINAIKRHHKIIKFIGHIYAYSEGIDVEKVVEVGNQYKLAFELNGAYLMPFKSHQADMNALKIMLSKADQIYVNSDAHTLSGLKDLRKKGFDLLKENGFFE